MGYNIKVSKPGEDVKRAKLKDLYMSSEHPSLNTHMEGSFKLDIPKGTSGNSFTFELKHGLDFTPMFLAWMGEEGYRYTLPYGYLQALTNETKFIVIVYLGPGYEEADRDYNYNGYYFIFGNKVE